MKPIATALVILFVFSVFATLTSAKESTTSSTTRKETVKERLETRKEKLEKRKETNKEKREDKIENLKERAASREAELKAKLAKFKDKKKAEIVERVSDNLNKINFNRVEHANKFLANATQLLDKLQNRVNQQASSGKDATDANAAITNAKAKIGSASAAVATQAKMDYTVTIASESGAKADTKIMRDKLHTDWKNVRSLMTSAKQAVSEAVRVAATTLGGTK